MTIDDLQSRLRREPFRRFVIELASGGAVPIGRDSELLFPRRRPELVIAFTDDGLQHQFEIGSVVRVAEA